MDLKFPHIDKMSPDALTENVMSLTDSGAKDNLMINRLLECMVDYDIEIFESIINEGIFNSGMEKTILKIIFPFLEKVGILVADKSYKSCTRAPR